MYTKDWVVKRLGGKEWGSIRSLIIDSTSRQLSYADVALTETNQVVRLPWSDLEVTHEGIFLKSTHIPLNTIMCSAQSASLDILKVPIRIPGKIGQRRPGISHLVP